MASASLANRGRTTGSLLLLLGAWGALVPFVGPYIGFAYTPDKAWAYTSGRLWLSVLPGAAAFVGGLLITGTDRGAGVGAYLAALGGTWFVIGLPVTAFAITSASKPISPGTPVAEHGAIFGPATMRFLEPLGFFYGLGVVIIFLAALTLGEVIVARLAARRYEEQLAAADYDQTQAYGNPVF
jgi:hypothetical protein